MRMLLVLLGIGALWIWYEPAPRLVSIDLNGIVRDFVPETPTSDLTDEEKLARTKALVSELEIELQVLAKKQNTIILTAPAVIAGAPDITEAVKQGMKK